MARARDIIQEIAETRARRRFGSAMSELPLRLFALENAFRKHDKNNTELTRYFPVALIACLEGYFRMAIKDLVDTGDPYLSNAEKPASSIRLDFAVLRAVHGKAVTVGEFVAHGVQLSRLEHVDGVLTALTGRDFLGGLRTTTDRWAHEVCGQPVTPVLGQPDQVFADVSRTFELRHIICHEIASAYEIDAEEVGRCFESCVAFLRAADEFIAETTHPGAPLTQTAMNIAAGESLEKARTRLTAAVEVLRSRLDEAEIAAFDTSQRNWQAYCDAWADFVAGDRATGGTIWPVTYCGAAETLVLQRTDELSDYRRLGDEA